MFLTVFSLAFGVINRFQFCSVIFKLLVQNGIVLIYESIQTPKEVEKLKSRSRLRMKKKVEVELKLKLSLSLSLSLNRNRVKVEVEVGLGDNQTACILAFSSQPKLSNSQFSCHSRST